MEVSATTVLALMSDPNIEALVAEYAAEARSPELPPAQPQWEQYAALERAGLFDIVAAREDGRLIGFISILRAHLPHYGGLVSVVESIFVSAASRRTGAGRALVKAGEAIAAEHCASILITARAGSALETILPRLGYRHGNQVFVRSVA